MLHVHTTDTRQTKKYYYKSQNQYTCNAGKDCNHNTPFYLGPVRFTLSDLKRKDNRINLKKSRHVLVCGCWLQVPCLFLEREHSKASVLCQGFHRCLAGNCSILCKAHKTVCRVLTCKHWKDQNTHKYTYSPQATLRDQRWVKKGTQRHTLPIFKA